MNSTTRLLAIQKILNTCKISIKNQDTYLRAFRHRSVSNDNYESLETLGDSFISAHAILYLVRTFGEKNITEEQLTKYKINIVKKETLARFADKLNLLPLIEISDDVKDNKDIESLKEDVFEALCGAIALDNCSDINCVSRFINTQLVSLDMARIKRDDNFKGKLNELAKDGRYFFKNERGDYNNVEYIVEKAKLKDGSVMEPWDGRCVNVTEWFVRAKIGDTLYGRGSGVKRKDAEQIAAKETWEFILKKC